jgi:hypothetical protein
MEEKCVSATCPRIIQRIQQREKFEKLNEFM